VETAVAAYCCTKVLRRANCLLILWLALNILAYRLALGFHVPGAPPCPCLGAITDILPISAPTINVTMWVLLTYMLLGSLFCLLTSKWFKNAEQTALAHG